VFGSGAYRTGRRIHRSRFSLRSPKAITRRSCFLSRGRRVRRDCTWHAIPLLDFSTRRRLPSGHLHVARDIGPACSSSPRHTGRSSTENPAASAPGSIDGLVRSIVADHIRGIASMVPPRYGGHVTAARKGSPRRFPAQVSASHRRAQDRKAADSSCSIPATPKASPILRDAPARTSGRSGDRRFGARLARRTRPQARAYRGRRESRMDSADYFDFMSTSSSRNTNRTRSRVSGEREAVRDCQSPASRSKSQLGADLLIARSRPMRHCSELKRYAVTGRERARARETGAVRTRLTGGRCTRAGARRNEPFVVVDCPSPPAPLWNLNCSDTSAARFTDATTPIARTVRDGRRGAALSRSRQRALPETQAKLLASCREKRGERLGGTMFFEIRPG